ncbi:MAG: two-component system sensor histidine kinase BaeS [Cellvibrionaceae bacterium]|jgi:two-component system sensor histidine kinase BaeS
MRSIALKLTLAFVLVSLTGILLMAWLVQVRIEPGISEFNITSRQESFIDFAEGWYVKNGSWDGIDRIGQDGNGNQGGNNNPRFGRGVLLTDTDFVVVFGRLAQYNPGKRLQPPDQPGGRPIEVNDQIAGYVYFQTPENNNGRNNNSNRGEALISPEEIFRNQFQRAILLGAGAAIAVALLAGALLAGTLSRPLRQLTSATHELAGGNLGHQVNVKSSDEIGELAGAFNTMSADLAEGERQRQQMTADIAHDLRTPLSVILGYTEALSDGKFEGDNEIYDAMHREAQQLNRLIDDLRTLSLADAGKLSLQKGIVPAAEILQQALSAWRMTASDKGVQLSTELLESFDMAVDPGRVAQILGNLISNGLRYTGRDGSITLTAFKDGNHGVLKVSDTGKGISAEKLPHIFDRFYRADSARQTNGGQSGLGLTIAKSLVEAHDGTITAASKIGEGTTFTITIPLA